MSMQMGKRLAANERGVVALEFVLMLPFLLIVLFGIGPDHPRLLGSWAFVQCISGVWAGVFGANSPFYNGMVAGLPAVALALAFGPQLPWPFVIMAWFLVPASALLAAAIMRFMRRRGP